MSDFADDLLPIRKIFVDGVEQPFIRDVDFKSGAFTVTVDTENGVLSIESSGVIAKDESTFGEEADVVSRLVRYFSTDSGIVTADSYTMANGEALYDFIITVNGKKRLDSDAYCRDHRVKYRRTASGAPSILGSLVSGTEDRDGDLATATSTIDLSSNDLRVRITPNTGSDVDWTITMQVQITRDVT